MLKLNKRVFLSIPFVLIFVFGLMFIEIDKTTNIQNYNKYFGDNGKYRQTYNKCFGNRKTNSEIFPKIIPSSAKIEEFCYYYYNSFDPNLLSYLVYTCSKEDFHKEIARLDNTYSCKEYYLYGVTGFNYSVKAVSTDDNGYIYALADKENNRLIYVGINFCDYFCDINYENIINKKYLPINFDASKGNQTDKGKSEKITMKDYKNGT